MRYDAIVVGAGPNGLAAAITLARAGCSVLVREKKATIGGAVATSELTLPGFRHDVGATVYPMGVGSPFFQTLPLEQHGLEWIQPPVPVAHPFDDGTAALLLRAAGDMAHTVGPRDGQAWRYLVDPFVDRWRDLALDILAPLKLPAHPIVLARFGLRALRSTDGLVRHQFDGERARALFGGIAAHATVPLHGFATAGFGVALTVAGHAVGWPLARGGAQSISDALAAQLRALGGEIATSAEVDSIDELDARIILLDLTPRGVLRVARQRLPLKYCRQLGRYRYGPAAFKVDWALREPIPWRAADCTRAATVHLCGSYRELAAAEAAVGRGVHAPQPYVLLVQPSLFDPTRAPPGRHTAWAYCHVPNGYTVDVTAAIEAQIERFAPGFRDVVLARHVMPPHALEEFDANLVGGDINGGVQDYRQLFTRPAARRVPYSTPRPGVFICSSATPPGGAVHGMCGYHAAVAALKAAGMHPATLS